MVGGQNEKNSRKAHKSGVVSFMLAFTASGQWVKLNLPANSTVYALAAISSTIFAGTFGSGGVLRSSDSGNSWISVNSGLTNINTRSFGVRDTEIFAGTKGGGASLSTNKGNSWTALNWGFEFPSTVLRFCGDRQRHLCRDQRRRHVSIESAAVQVGSQPITVSAMRTPSMLYL